MAKANRSAAKRGNDVDQEPVLLQFVSRGNVSAVVGRVAPELVLFDREKAVDAYKLMLAVLERGLKGGGRETLEIDRRRFVSAAEAMLDLLEAAAAAGQ